MRVGLISDIHFGFHKGSKVNEQGVNVREQDFIDAGNAALSNLVGAGVDVIVDGGDMAHVPAPKKRAIGALIDHIRSVDFLRYLSADGNHTSLKSTSDVHLYSILSQECPNFVGATQPIVTEEGIALIPHSYDPQDVVRYIDEAMRKDPILMVGHFAASNIRWDDSKVDLKYVPTDIPVFLGHYHRHIENEDGPSYIGSTERTAWDQWDFPTGATVYDTDTKEIEYIRHDSRRFVDIWADGETYLDALNREDLEDAMVRLTITASPQEWNSLNTRETQRLGLASGALMFHQRRGDTKSADQEIAPIVGADTLVQAWQAHIKSSDLPEAYRKDIERMGIEALG